MVVRRKNRKRMASLSALAAGALALTPRDAEASIVHVDENQKIGYSSGYASSFTVNLPGAANFDLLTEPGGGVYAVFAQAGPSNRVRFATATTSEFALQGFSAGKKWGASLHANASGNFAQRTAGASTSNQTTFSTNQRYFLFTFQDSLSGNALRYGWGQVLVAGSTTSGPDVTFVDYAYDNSGATIAAGNAGAPAVPEPSAFMFTGLGALVLGAAGVRGWRARSGKNSFGSEPAAFLA